MRLGEGRAGQSALSRPWLRGVSRSILASGCRSSGLDAPKEHTRERVPLKWAATQNNLGGALVRLGEREGRPERLEQAVAAYTEALKERTRERVPLEWAMTQHNLGRAIQLLRERGRAF